MRITITKALFCISALLSGIAANAQQTIDGLKYSSAVHRNVEPGAFRNKFVVLDFWATWCGPCIASFPKLKDLEHKYHNRKDIVFASITAESKGKIDTFFDQRKDVLTEFVHLIDNKGASWRYFGIEFIPTVLVFSPEGKVVFKGHVEELSKKMDQLLKGHQVLAEERPAAQPEEWKMTIDRAEYVALTGNAGPRDESSQSTSQNKEHVVIDLKATSLADAVSIVGKVTTTRIKNATTGRGQLLINLYYKQNRNKYPEFDKGVFAEQYQNHVMHLLERSYGFRAKWVPEETTAYKIVVKDAKLLAKNATLSTHGSSMSRIDEMKKQYNFVNHTLQAFADNAEEALGEIVYVDGADTLGYDATLEFSCLAGFTSSLASYGLGLEKMEKYEVRKLDLVLDPYIR